jgi:TonB family protein
MVGFVNANSGLQATGADSSWAGISLVLHAAIFALLPLWRVGVGFEDPLDALEAGGGGIIYVMPVLPEDAPEPETGGALVSADLRGDEEGTGAVAGATAGGSEGQVVSDSDYGSLFDVLGERMRRGRSILPTLAVPTTDATAPAEAGPGVVETPAPVEADMDEPAVDLDVTTVELADLPASDSLDLGRLTGLRPELAFMTASAWVLIRNQEEVEAYLRRTYREGRLDPAVRGTVSVTLWIDQQGAVEWAEVSQSSGRTDLDEVALALFNEVADFRAARDRGQTVSRSVTFSLNFPW